jgi:hypothetical protein
MTMTMRAMRRNGRNPIIVIPPLWEPPYSLPCGPLSAILAQPARPLARQLDPSQRAALSHLEHVHLSRSAALGNGPATITTMNVHPRGCH